MSEWVGALIFTRPVRVIRVRIVNTIKYSFANCAPFKAFPVDIITADAAFPTRFPEDNFAVVVKNVAVGAFNALVLWTMCAEHFRSILLLQVVVTLNSQYLINWFNGNQNTPR